MCAPYFWSGTPRALLPPQTPRLVLKERSGQSACPLRLKDAGIKQIYVTDARRTQQTAAPLAKALKITPTILPAKDPNGLIKNLVYTGGGNILVVGHSDTLPFVIARIQGGTVPPIGENEYDRMFVMTIAAAAGMPAATLHYCSAGTSAKPAPTPAHPAKAPAKKKRCVPSSKKKAGLFQPRLCYACRFALGASLSNYLTLIDVAATGFELSLPSKLR